MIEEFSWIHTALLITNHLMWSVKFIDAVVSSRQVFLVSIIHELLKVFNRTTFVLVSLIVLC